MNQDQYAELLQKFIQKETDVSQKQQKLVEAKANLTGYKDGYIDQAYIPWEMAEAIAQYESRVTQANNDLRKEEEDFLKLRSAVILNLPVKNIGVSVPIKHSEIGRSVLNVKAVQKEGTRGDVAEDFTLFVDEKQY
jgi:hypothetical protein